MFVTPLLDHDERAARELAFALAMKAGIDSDRLPDCSVQNQFLPWLLGRPIADITAHDFQRWYASFRRTPMATDRPAPILSVIMCQAEVYATDLAFTAP